jgi:hypothetical protein
MQMNNKYKWQRLKNVGGSQSTGVRGVDLIHKVATCTIYSKYARTRVPLTVHNTPVKISDMVIFLHHDLYNIDSTCIGHHIIATYFL